MGSINFSRIDNAQLQFTINEKSKKSNKKWIPSNEHHLLMTVTTMLQYMQLTIIIY